MRRHVPAIALVLACLMLGICAGAAIVPRVEYRPASVVPIGFPGDYPPKSVSSRFLGAYGFYVVNDGQRIYALSAKCTHLGCTVNWDAARGEFECPCHRSRFKGTGEVRNPPALKALPRFGMRFDGKAGLLVDTSVESDDGDPLGAKGFCYPLAP